MRCHAGGLGEDMHTVKVVSPEMQAHEEVLMVQGQHKVGRKVLLAYLARPEACLRFLLEQAHSRSAGCLFSSRNQTPAFKLSCRTPHQTAECAKHPGFATSAPGMTAGFQAGMAQEKIPKHAAPYQHQAAETIVSGSHLGLVCRLEDVPHAHIHQRIHTHPCIARSSQRS